MTSFSHQKPLKSKIQKHTIFGKTKFYYRAKSQRKRLKIEKLVWKRSLFDDSWPGVKRCNCLKLDSGTTIFAIAVILQPYPTGPRQRRKQTIHRLGDKATASASPSRVQNFKMASLSFVSYGSPLFAISKCNSCSISSCLILPLPADHRAWQRNSEENSWGLRTNTKSSGLFARKSLATMTNEFSYFFSPVPTRQNDYQCFGNMDDSRPQFGCQSFIML